MLLFFALITICIFLQLLPENKTMPRLATTSAIYPKLMKSFHTRQVRGKIRLPYPLPPPPASSPTLLPLSPSYKLQICKRVSM